MFKSNIKYVPTDTVMDYLIADGSTNYVTSDWNPLIFAIFYEKIEIVEYFLTNPFINIRSCLIKPF